MKVLLYVFASVASALLCGGVCATAAGQQTDEENVTLPHKNVTKQWLCEWWKKKLTARHYSIAMKTNVVREYQALYKEHSNYSAHIAETGAAENFQDVGLQHQRAEAKFWDAFWLMSGVSRSVTQFLSGIELLQDHLFENRFDFRKCNKSIIKFQYYSNHTFSGLHDELENSTEQLMNFSGIHNETYRKKFHDRLKKSISSLDQGKNFSALAQEARVGFNTTLNALTHARERKHAFDGKVAFGCLLEKNLNIMKDIFVALEFMLKGVLAREGVLLKRAALLRASAAKLDVEVPDVVDTEAMRMGSVSAAVEVSSALTRVLAAMYNSTQASSHTLLQYGSEFQHNISHCKSDTQMERAVLLHLVADERRNHFDDFNTWKSATAALWTEVSSMVNYKRTHCKSWKNIHCDVVFTQVNSLVESSRKSCENAEKTLGDAIRILVSADDQIKRGKSILEAALRERAMQSEMGPTDTVMEADARATEGTAGGHAGTSTSAPVRTGSAVDVSLVGLDDESPDTDADRDDDFEFDAGATTAVRSGKGVTTIVLLVVVPIAVAAFAAVALFMLRNQRQSSKSAADY
ncbi:hypothetical protein ERJ75_000861800 [Trypanosoma vivax]|uniref:65 kDa invariant surface glycoprotein n=1 Tax=Trypanosoma vivax (strain Y486) TaxID=1055687 RepID=F9WPP0_TRYVY|nr:hypothetical protein ERJ75_000861800 [Trypanosoma vivax]CCD19517.1 hypothetical protein, conserved in T. vivax [Trypanosoma vivax Y486]|eukprot:CCD19517.1 hypothetical protein, conserved in T. vivax [Trypanosoma vivax Y486]